MTDKQALVLRTPDNFAAALQHLIGFVPSQSLIAVALSSGENGEPVRVTLTQRIDLPRSPQDNAVVAGHVVDAMSKYASGAVLLAVYSERDQETGVRGEPTDQLPYAALVDQVIGDLDDQGISTQEAMLTNGGRRWSYGCTDPVCCPAEGNAIPWAVKSQIAAEFAVAGAVSVGSRSDLEMELAHVDDPDVVEAIKGTEVSEMVYKQGAKGKNSATLRDLYVMDLHGLASKGQKLAPAEVAMVVTALKDIRLRDTYLWDLTKESSPESRRAAAAMLAQVVREAPPELVAPAATVLAVQQWQLGDGARANVALARANEAEADYGLAVLVGHSMRVGLQPSAWAEAMQNLSRDECLRGPGAASSRAAAPAAVTAPPTQGLAL